MAGGCSFKAPGCNDGTPKFHPTVECGTGKGIWQINYAYEPDAKAQAQGSEKRERGPSVDMGAVPPLNLDYWDLHPHMGFAGVVMLEDDTKMQLEVLFGMIDRDHSGVITHDDFVFVTNMEQVHGMQRHSSHETVTRLHCSPHHSSTHVTRSPGRAALPPPLTRRSHPSQVDQAATTALMQREVLRKWEALRQEMDFNGDGCVSAAGGFQRRSLPSRAARYNASRWDNHCRPARDQDAAAPAPASERSGRFCLVRTTRRNSTLAAVRH